MQRSRKIKNSCSLKGIIKRKKRQATDWKKIFANHISDKEPIVRMYFLKKLKIPILRKLMPQ